MSEQCSGKAYVHKEHAFWNQSSTTASCAYFGSRQPDDSVLCQRHAFRKAADLVDYIQQDGTRTTCPIGEIEKIVASEEWGEGSITLTVPFGVTPANFKVEA